MENITARLNHAKNLYRQSNFIACERLYRELFYKNQDAFDRNDRVFFLDSINEVGIKGNFSSVDLEEQEKFISDNFSQEDCYNRTFKDPYALIFLNMSKTYYKKRNYLKAITTLWNLKPDFLSAYNSPNVRGFDYSPRERWYFNLIDSLIGLKKYEDALDYAERSLEEIKGSKSEAPIWIRYKSAKVCQFVGEYKKALDILMDISVVKNESFVYARIASCHFRLGNCDDALSYAARAALANRSIQNSIGTYSLLADILERLERTEESIKHD